MISFCDCRKFSKSDNIHLDHLEHCKAVIEAQFARFGDEVVLNLILQNEQPGLAGLLVICGITFRAAANGGHADAVGVVKVNAKRGNAFAVHHVHERHAVGPPDLCEGVALRE